MHSSGWRIIPAVLCFHPVVSNLEIMFGAKLAVTFRWHSPNISSDCLLLQKTTPSGNPSKRLFITSGDTEVRHVHHVVFYSLTWLAHIDMAPRHGKYTWHTCTASNGLYWNEPFFPLTTGLWSTSVILYIVSPSCHDKFPFAGMQYSAHFPPFW